MRFGTLTAVFAAALGWGVCAAEPIVFGSAGLELLVRAQLNIPNDEPIDDADPRLATITEIVGVPLQIDSLAGIEFLVNLEVLVLPGNDVEDLVPLADLTQLRELDLAGNFVSDLGPIAGLTDLELLDLTGNMITSVAALREIRGLNQLRLGMNMITQISALANLIGPSVLELNDNEIRDAGPLLSIDDFPLGATIDLRGNPLSNDSLCSVVLPLLDDGLRVFADGECPGLIVGTIRELASSRPVPCALVLAESNTGSLAIGPSALDGTYQIDGLPPGRNTLNVYAPSFISKSGEGSVEPSTQRRISFELSRRSSSGFDVVEGRITDAESGSELAGVQVLATVGQRRVGETYTCATGRYQLLLNGNDPSAMVTYSALGYEDQVVTTAGAASQTINLNLVPIDPGEGSVSGRVFDGRQLLVRGLVGARVTVKVEGGAIAYTTETDALGNYSVTGLRFGIYTVRVSALGIADGVAQRSVEVEGSVDDFEFTLGRFIPRDDPSGCEASGSTTMPGSNAVTEFLMIFVAVGMVTWSCAFARTRGSASLPASA